MPLSFHIDEGLGLVVTSAEGEVTGEDLIEHARSLIAFPDRPLRELVDFSERSEITVPVDQVRRMGEMLRKGDVNAPGAKLAMVAKTDAVFGMLRIYQAHRAHESVDICVFRDRGEALRWLGIDVLLGN